MNRSAGIFNQAVSAARLSTSGRLPCDNLVKVDALTPEAADTSFHVRRRATRSESSAECSAETSNCGGSFFFDFTLAILRLRCNINFTLAIASQNCNRRFSMSDENPEKGDENQAEKLEAEAK